MWQRLPIARIEDDPSALSVKADSGFKSVKDVVEYARKNPGKLTYGTSGIGSDDHLAVLSFARQAGIGLRHIPFDGSAPARAAAPAAPVDPRQMTKRCSMSAMDLSESEGGM